MHVTVSSVVCMWECDRRLSAQAACARAYMPLRAYKRSCMRYSPRYRAGAPHWLLSRGAGPGANRVLYGGMTPIRGHIPQTTPIGVESDQFDRISVDCLFYLKETSARANGGLLPRVCAHQARPTGAPSPAARLPVVLVPSLCVPSGFASGYGCTLVRPG